MAPLPSPLGKLIKVPIMVNPLAIGLCGVNSSSTADELDSIYTRHCLELKMNLHIFQRRHNGLFSVYINPLWSTQISQYTGHLYVLVGSKYSTYIFVIFSWTLKKENVLKSRQTVRTFSWRCLYLLGTIIIFCIFCLVEKHKRWSKSE